MQNISSNITYWVDFTADTHTHTRNTCAIRSISNKQEGQKYGYDTEAFAIYDTMKYVNPPVHTVAVGTAWGEAAMLLASGEKGHRAALPSASIMIKQPIDAFRGQASNLEIARNEIRNTKRQTLEVLSKGIGKDMEEIEKDINRPKYFNPWEAVDYGLIDQVLDGTKKKPDVM